MDLASLNPPQREAVTHVSGPLLVLAGAGSGKTRVITFRIAHLLAGGVDPRHIAALTFTNKAAGEMRHRIAELLRSKKKASELTMGTFHSLGLQVLKSERKALGFPRGFVIYDTADQLGVVREILRKVQSGGDRRYDAKAILSRISLAKNAFVGPEDYDDKGGDEYDHVTAEVYPRYQRMLKSFAAVDFDDLITETVRLFQRDEEVRERWKSKFRHVLVDEFQDTNRAQLLLVKTLVEDHDNICCVGDDDQSIYSWRGADPTNILRFETTFPGAKVVKLEQNYRSSKHILAAANAVISHNRDRYGKTLWSARGEGPKIVCAVAPDADAEARFVALEIGRLKDEEQLAHKDFAVLYRSNKQAKLIEEELRAAQIPYAMYGGQQFFERKEVKDLIAYLRVALNPRDEISLRRIINYPGRGIGITTIEKISAFAQAQSMPLWNGLARAHELPDIRTQTKRAIVDFVELVNRLGIELERGAPVVPTARKLIEDIDLYGDLRAAAPSLTAAQRRIDNVESLLRSLAAHEEREPGRQALSEYLRKLCLDTGDDNADKSGDRVTLTTLHGAKGLEFPVVFLIGAEEEILPHARTLVPQASDVNDPEHATDVGEERRLAYVGITRAQRRLFVSRTSARLLRGKQVPRVPSRFLLEIPPELVEERDIGAENSAIVDAAELSAFFQRFASD